MGDVSDSVRIQQAMQRLIRWHGAARGRRFWVYGWRDEGEGLAPLAYTCRLDDEDGTAGAASRSTPHDAIDAALDEAEAPT